MLACSVRSALRASRAGRVLARPVPLAVARVPPSWSRAYASASPPVSPTDPKLAHAQSLLEDGTRALEEGDMPRAKAAYEESIGVLPTSGAWFNLGVVEYQLSGPQGAIAAWKQSIALEPSADAYTNLGSAYMMCKPPQAAEAIKALTAAMEIAPHDPEVQFNLAAVLESTDQLDTALTLYRKALEGGIERALPNIRNIGGKILAKRLAEEKSE
ncbi:hypothetical protein CspeluHIS016_0202060 [Cutaneotrichosporon spelunceum]|uniref:TPR-like protein n=1 Tax=Cutaneotrichosporon spelunceum TaxID=1672016 RepID=A0AAD3TRN3_9TREE|nr:hypothetical protein CspeluHIS016_0202060 [Cutaneotrichosporon spelunceum]